MTQIISKRKKWVEKLNDGSVDKYIVQLELDLENKNDITMREFNDMVSSAACRT